MVNLTFGIVLLSLIEQYSRLYASNFGVRSLLEYLDEIQKHSKEERASVGFLRYCEYCNYHKAVQYVLTNPRAPYTTYFDQFNASSALQRLPAFKEVQ